VASTWIHSLENPAFDGIYRGVWWTPRNPWLEGDADLIGYVPRHLLVKNSEMQLSELPMELFHGIRLFEQILGYLVFAAGPASTKLTDFLIIFGIFEGVLVDARRLSLTRRILIFTSATCPASFRTTKASQRPPQSQRSILQEAKTSARNPSGIADLISPAPECS
jgi:hypothetical protein